MPSNLDYINQGQWGPGHMCKRTVHTGQLCQGGPGCVCSSHHPTTPCQEGTKNALHMDLLAASLQLSIGKTSNFCIQFREAS